jgi:hypothetical protein
MPDAIVARLVRVEASPENRPDRDAPGGSAGAEGAG